MSVPGEFPIIDVLPKVPHAEEAMGTKPKFWYYDEYRVRWLYKRAREGTGEDWSEKIAAELAELLGLPHARYELALHGGMRGTVSPSFLPGRASLVHGNELLRAVDPAYPDPGRASRQFYRVSQHTVEAILKTLADEQVRLPLEWASPPGISAAADVFVGYLLLDAWIGNTDRHHENWGLAVVAPALPSQELAAHLAPTYDHASSLGRELSDQQRRERLATKDRGYSLEAYVEKCRCALYAREGDRKPLTAIGAFQQAAQGRPEAARVWLDRLAAIRSVDTAQLLGRVPRERCSAAAVDFAQKVLEISHQGLLDLRKSLS